MSSLYRDIESNEKMVVDQIIKRGIESNSVINAFFAVDRVNFVPKEIKESSYLDRAMPIGNGQTISQPYIVAEMTELLNIKGTEKILEIGTGSGYQTAILSVLAKEVYTVERIEELLNLAKERLFKHGFLNIRFRLGDGYEGWEDYAPFDRIIVTAAPEEIPNKLIKQLKIGGIMVLPMGKPKHVQELYRIVKTNDGFIAEEMGSVVFVPMLKDIRLK